MSNTTPANRKRGSLWAVVTVVLVLVVAYFMFFDSREGDAPVAAGTVATDRPGEAGSRAPVPVGDGTPAVRP